MVLAARPVRRVLRATSWPSCVGSQRTYKPSHPRLLFNSYFLSGQSHKKASRRGHGFEYFFISLSISRPLRKVFSYSCTQSGGVSDGAAAATNAGADTGAGAGSFESYIARWDFGTGCA